MQSRRIPVIGFTGALLILHSPVRRPVTIAAKEKAETPSSSSNLQSSINNQSPSFAPSLISHFSPAAGIMFATSPTFPKTSDGHSPPLQASHSRWLTPSGPRPCRGFALVITLSLMILLTIIAVGLLSLATIALRSSSQGQAEATARANARLALMLAIGDLQLTLGRDTSVSAPAESVVSGPVRPHLTGTWQRAVAGSTNWHWTPSATSAPAYSSKASLFRRWLVSTAKPADAANFGLPSTPLSTGVNVVTLVGNPASDLKNNGLSTVVNADKVKVTIRSQQGKFAWSVFDENTKAPIQLGNPTIPQTVGQEIASRNAAYRVRADILDPKLKPSLAFPENLLSLDTAVIQSGVGNRDEFRKRFHDFTTLSTGLLTDTANGGLKVDLTPLFEEPGISFPSDSFVAPNTISPYAYPTMDPVAAGATTWNYLRDHYRKYKTVSASGEELIYKPDSASDLAINPTGLSPSPDKERLLPVIAKFQLVFSIVTHYSYLKSRRDGLNNIAVPKGYLNYGIPNLVYDPVITLYNPYDVSLDLNRLRIRVWDPPVGFRFKKVDNQKGTSVYFRPNDKDPSGEVRFRGLANFRYGLETNNTARKCFTLILTDGTNAASGTKLKLLPGEVRVFSPRVEDNWTWQMEAGNGTTDSFPVRSFFDYGSSNFANIDGRTASGIGRFGIEAVPGWTTYAGLQTDHLSNTARDPSTLYDYEKSSPNNIGGFVNLKITDDVVVEAKPLVTKGNATKSFQVDVLAGIMQGSVGDGAADGDTSNTGVSTDTLRSYSFNFANATDPSGEISANIGNPIVSRQFNVIQILQGPTDQGGKKKPFAMLEMSARTTRDDLTDSKPWLYNNPIVEGAVQTSTAVGLANQSYDLRFAEMTSFSGFPNGIDIDPTTNRGYFGAAGSSQLGSSFVQMMHVPVAPAASLGDLIHSNLVSGSQLPRVVHPLGNSRAHPLIPVGAITNTLADGGVLLDHSFLLNHALWDKYFFSSVAGYAGPVLGSMSRSQVLSGIFAGTSPALNSRLVPVSNTGDSNAKAQEVDSLGAVPLSRQMAKYLGVNGAFNLNSTSLDAWKSVLSSLRERTVNGGKPSGVGSASTVSAATYDNPDKTPFVRMGKPLAGSDAINSIRWAGFRSLSDAQIDTLAKSIVAEITKCGVQDKAPAFSLGEFINRRVGESGDLHTLNGLLQTAIDNTDINKDSILLDSKTLSFSSVPAVRKTGVAPASSKTMDGNSSEGAPSMLTQGDLMNALSSIVTVRGDTFKIRCYGEATGPDGATILARAWCEAIVQRVPEFLDPSDAPETAISALSSNANKTFGRRFKMVLFRWLLADEI